MSSEKIFIGGWYQRTMLHLSEIYDFLRDGASPLDLDEKNLISLRQGLRIEAIEMRVRDFEFINIQTKHGIKIRIFEDGLISLNIEATNIKKDIAKLTSFFENDLSPALNYLFSLGAPVPKELANIKTVYPYFVVLNQASKESVKKILAEFKQGQYFEIIKKEFEIYRGDKLYVINNVSEKIETIERLINEQIFVREFKGQLHRYLNLHRSIWEKIATVKERGEIYGHEAGQLKSQIDSYSKTVNLISSRINQMGIYVGTRGKIVKNDQDLQRIAEVLQYKYETLVDSLDYIIEIWVMTKNYLDSARDVFAGIQAKSTEASIKNLTVITSSGVAASLIALFNQKVPEVTTKNLTYSFILILIGYTSNKIMQTLAQRKKYKINEPQIDTDI